MYNFKDPTKPTDGGTRSNPNALKDWNAEVQRAKLTYVRDKPFPKQDKSLVNGEQHSLLSCLYYHELSRLDNLTVKERKAKETKDVPLGRGNT